MTESGVTTHPGRNRQGIRDKLGFMLVETLAEVTIYEVPRICGWALLKLVTLGRYKSDPTNVLIEGLVGFASIVAASWLVIRWL